MRIPKLFSILSELSEAKQGQLADFIASPYFNKSKQIKVYYRLLLEHAPSFSTIDKEKLFFQLFKIKPYDDQKMRLLNSRLLKLVEQFLSLDHYIHDTHTAELYSLQALADLPLKDYFVLQYEKVKKNIHHHAKSSPQLFYQKLKLEEIWSRYLFSLNDRNIPPNIDTWSTSIDTYYLIQKLQVIAAANSYKAFVKTDFNIELKEEVLRTSANQQYPFLIQAYRLTALLQQNSDDKQSFSQLKKMINQSIHEVAADEAREICTLARNFCIRRINKGDSSFYHEIFDIYKLELTHEILLEQGELSPASYKNIVSTALFLDEYKWLEHFFKTYTKHLPANHQEPQYTFNMARVRFKEKKYKEVIHLLSKVEYTDVLLSNSIKAMLCKAYFELDELNALDSLLDSFRVYLQRKGKMAYHQKVYLNFIKFLRRIINVNMLDKIAVEKIKSQLVTTKEIIDQDWLLEKLG